MAEVKVFYDREGKTLTVWFTERSREYVCEETGEEVVLMKDASGRVLGFEKLNFSIPQHCYEYCNTLGWFYDNFDHPRRLRLLYVAAAFVTMTAWHQKGIGEMVAQPIHPPAGADKLSAGELLARIDVTTCAQNAPESLAWTQAYLRRVADRGPLVSLMALDACKLGNDPHNQEIPQNMLEDFLKSRSPNRDRLLMACAKHSAGHRKYGDPMEAARRFGEGVGVSIQ